jgi:hypothetical protein
VAKSRQPKVASRSVDPGYRTLVASISDLLDHARQASARAVNAILTASYWEVGRRLVEFEQGGQARAEYGGALLKRLAQDLTTRHGRGFGMVNLSLMRRFYLAWPAPPACFVGERHGTGPHHYAARLGDLVLELYPTSNASPPDPRLRIGFAVRDLDETLRSVGQAVVASKTAWGLRAVVRDPDGRAVELCQNGTGP